jgi:hypothetical protein
LKGRWLFQAYRWLQRPAEENISGGSAPTIKMKIEIES